ncbi:LAFA_0F03576g1_1 [Lachancea sp. 'fantastica']|nr:LAFA_0F03576g1_1 [Lachancea sp. 'fantastica']
MIVPRKLGHSRRLYSGAISQDFLKNVLERVKETAAKKPTFNRPNPRSRAPRRANDNGETGRNQYGKKSGNRNAVFANGPATNDSNMAGRKPGINASIINRQPQFRRRRTGADDVAKKDASSESIGIMDALDSTSGVQFRPNRSQQASNSTGRKPRAPRTAQRSIPGRTNSSSSVEGIASQVRKSTPSQQYSPEEPTPLGLLKYAPKLAFNSFSKMTSFGLATLQENDFPLTRPVNLGVVTSPSENPRNVSLSPNYASFSKFMPASSLAWGRERLFKNTAVSLDVSQFEKAVKGEYIHLSPADQKAFEGIAKNAKKRDDLVKNSDIVRLSLEKSNMDIASKDLVFNVCSGLKPVSQLKV